MEKKVVLKYVAHNGDEAEIIPSFFVPLGFEDLFLENKTYEIKAHVDSGDGKINGKTIEQSSVCKIPINFHSNISIYGLVQNGWLPITFLNSDFIVPDRNFLSSIIQIRENNLKPNTEATKWWLEFYRKSDFIINPILYAFEGNKKRKPTFDEFCMSFNKAVKELAEYFPNAKIITYNSEHVYKASYSVLEEMADKYEDEINFLLKTAPLVATPHSDKQLKQLHESIDIIALKHKCLGNSLLYILVLSCLYEENNNNVFKAARKVLKPKKNYSIEDAYNAISDINSLLLFVQYLSMFDFPHSICTCDKALTAFWAAINPIEITITNSKINLEFNINEYLFPRLNTEQRINLANTIKSKMTI